MRRRTEVCEGHPPEGCDTARIMWNGAQHIRVDIGTDRALFGSFRIIFF